MATFHLGDIDNSYTALAAGDVVYGEGGNDGLTSTAGGAVLFGGDGDDTLDGSSGNDVLQGDDGNNLDAHNLVRGAGGDDVIAVFSANDTVFGGNGDDTVDVFRAGPGQLVVGGSGIDTLNLDQFSNASRITLALGPTFTLRINGTNSGTYRDFERLNFVGLTGSFDITGGILNDTFLVNNLSSAGFQAGILDGSDGDDQFIINEITTSKTELILGGLGNDDLRWSAINPLTSVNVEGGAGQIRANGRTFLAFTNIETLSVNALQVIGAFRYDGLITNDFVFTNAATAIVDTYGGDDSISVAAAIIKVSAGIGNDVVNVTATGAAPALVHGDDGNDMLSGSGLAHLFGGTGNDQLNASSNQTSLFGGAGRDLLNRIASNADATTSPARLDGGAGLDILSLKLNSLGMNFQIDFSQAQVTLYDGTTVQNIEIVRYDGGFGVDVVTSSNHVGGAASNRVNGNFGNDSLTAASNGALLDGGLGNDALLGGTGKDHLIGNSGDDAILAGAGNDTIDGGTGIDLMTGGGGADRFVYLFNEATPLAAPHDRITDFSTVENDIIDLSAIDALAATVGLDEAFQFVGFNGLTGAAGELGYQWVDNAGTANDSTQLIYTRVAGAGTCFATLDGLLTLTQVDFVL